MLAVEILRKQGVSVLPVAFKTDFFSARQAEESARKLGVSLRIVDISEEFLEKVKNPAYGRGSGLNPCIDCHLLMLEKAKEMMEKEGFLFVATGEVLGERPMSQNKKAMEIVKEESGLNGYLLRPLSAKLLEPSVPEKKGWVDRELLFDVRGRQRKKQIKLARKLGVGDYPTPAGGCILCEKEFAVKLKKLLEICPGAKSADVKLLKRGRHFWQKGVKIVVGRDHEENVELKKLAQEGDVLVELEGVPGPTTLLRVYEEGAAKKALQKAKKLTKKYANKAEGEVSFKIKKI